MVRPASGESITNSTASIYALNAMAYMPIALTINVKDDAGKTGKCSDGVEALAIVCHLSVNNFYGIGILKLLCTDTSLGFCLLSKILNWESWHQPPDHFVEEG